MKVRLPRPLFGPVSGLHSARQQRLRKSNLRRPSDFTVDPLRSDLQSAPTRDAAGVGENPGCLTDCLTTADGPTDHARTRTDSIGVKPIPEDSPVDVCKQGVTGSSPVSSTLAGRSAEVAYGAGGDLGTGARRILDHAEPDATTGRKPMTRAERPDASSTDSPTRVRRWVFRRHAHPVSAWSRWATTPLIVLPLWTRNWRTAVPVAAWFAVNPVMTPPVTDDHAFATRAMLGEERLVHRPGVAAGPAGGQSDRHGDAGGSSSRGLDPPPAADADVPRRIDGDHAAELASVRRLLDRHDSRRPPSPGSGLNPIQAEPRFQAEPDPG